MDKHILVVDCGSTGIRSLVFDNKGKILNRYYKRIEVLHPEKGATENSPEDLWEAFKSVVKKSINTPFSRVEAIGITNQRSTFALWDKETGKPLTNFINWQDVRSAETVNKMNKKPIWLLLKTAAFFIGRLLRNPLLIVTSMLKLSTDHSICKLRWVLDNNKNILDKCNKGEVLFGTIDSWLMYKISNGKQHVTDYTNAAATTLLNPFMMKWNTLFCKIFKIPMNILPVVYNTNDLFGETMVKDFGKKVPITCIAGDQQASLFGHRCFNKGDVKVSLGSGAFVCMNVGDKPKFSPRGLFPMIGWTIKGKPQYILEGQVATVGTYINWTIEQLKLFSTPQELDKYATDCKDTNGLFCIPTLTGIRFPYFKPNLTSSFIGMDLTTEKKHIARAILEGIAHRVVDIIEGMEKDTKITITSIKADGGVSNSDILLQIISDFSGKTIYRSSEHDLTSIGAAYFSGLAIGIWDNLKEIERIYIPQKKFSPKINWNQRKEKRLKWKENLKILYYT